MCTVSAAASKKLGYEYILQPLKLQAKLVIFNQGYRLVSAFTLVSLFLVVVVVAIGYLTLLGCVLARVL